MKKTILLLAAMCCLVINSWSADDVITYVSENQLELDAEKFTPNFTGHTFDESTHRGIITFPSAVTAIGDRAFYDMMTCTNIILPDQLQTIGNEAFKYLYITTITIPNSVISIGDEAFYNTNIMTVYIGSGVTHIGKDAFNACHKLISIEVDATNTSYCSVDGVLLTKAQDELLTYPEKNPRTSYTVPNTVTTIGPRAMAGCNLRTIILPSSLTTLDEYALSNPNWEKIICKAVTPPTCVSMVFGGVETSIPVYVQAGCISNYQTTQGWNKFTNYVEYAGYGVYVKGNQILSAICDDVLGDSTVAYVAATKTLTLNNANIAYMGEAIAAYEPITIDCMGNDTVECTSANHNALYCEANSLTFSGSGSVRLIAPQEAAINLSGEMIIRGGCTVTVSSGTDVAIAMTGEPLTIDGASLIAKGNGKNPTIAGCNNLILKNGATIRSAHTYDATSHKFYVKGTTNEAKDDIIIGIGGTGIEEVTGDRLQVTGSHKVLRNGQLIILRDGKTYNAQGAIVE